MLNGNGVQGSWFRVVQRVEGKRVEVKNVRSKGFADKSYWLEADPAFVRGLGLEIGGMGFSSKLYRIDPQTTCLFSTTLTILTI